MVAYTDVPIVDVVIVVEDTALGSTSIQDIRTNYLLPALEHFNGGPVPEVEFASLACSSSYTLVPFRASDCMPEPPTRILGPFTSIKKVLNVFDNLKFSGGRGDTYSSGQEGLAAALEVFDSLIKRRGKDIATSRHIIYICNSPCYDMPIIENVRYNGKTLDEVAQLVSEQNIHFSIFTPRKLPFFYKLYEKCGGDLASAKEKNYSRDPRHLVLLKGFGLQERPITPKPTITASTLPLQQGPLGTGGNQAMLSGGQTSGMAQQIRPQQPPGPSGQFRSVGGQMPQQQGQGQPGPGGGGPVRPVLEGILNQQMPTQQQKSTTLAELLNQPPQGINPNLGMQQRVGMQGQPQSMPGLGQPAGMQQQQQQQQQSSMQQQQVGMQHSGMQQPQQGMMQQQQQPGMPQQQPGMPSQQPGMAPRGQQGSDRPREREVIWNGELEWSEKVRDGPGDQKITHSVACSVSTSKENGVQEVKPDNWPPKLIMQLIPKSLVQTIGGEYFRNSKSVLFHPNDCESLEALTKVMGTGFAGCVHFTGPCDIKVLILLYSNDKKAYLGFIPNDQTSFVDRIRTVIQKQKQGQQQQQQQQGRAMGPGNMMGPGPNMQMMGQGQNMMGQQMMMGQQGQVMPGQQGMMSQRMMSGPGSGMGGQQQIIRSGSGMGGPQYVRMNNSGQNAMVGGGQRMMNQQGMTPGLRQILQQQPGMMPQSGGVMMQQQGMQGGMQNQQGMMMQQQRPMMNNMMSQGGQGNIMPGSGVPQQNDPMLRELLN